MLFVDGSNVSDVCACVKDLDLLYNVGENLVNLNGSVWNSKACFFFFNLFMGGDCFDPWEDPERFHVEIMELMLVLLVKLHSLNSEMGFGRLQCCITFIF